MNKLVRRDQKRRNKVYAFELSRLILKEQIYDARLPETQRLKAQLFLSQYPRDACKVRVRNRCVVTGRARGVERYFRMSRLVLRTQASNGMLAGVVKASW